MNLNDPLQPNRRILIVDDNEAIHLDLRKVLVGAGVSDETLQEDEAVLFGDIATAGTVFEVDSAFQGQEALVRVETSVAAGKPYALAFVDIRMPPGWDGIETISRLWKADPDLQIVICTAYSDYSWDKMVRRLGYSENLIILKKPFDNIEVLQLAHALTRKWLVTHQARIRMEDLDRLVALRTTELQAANQQLQLSEERFAKAFSASPIPLALLDGASGCFVDVNDRFLEITGHPREAILGRTCVELSLWPEGTTTLAATAPGDLPRLIREQPGVFRTQAGEVREALISTEPLRLAQGTHLLLILQDIADRVRMEQRLRQAQKMEAVGQLAAGIAHHFNNLHTVILGNIALCEEIVAEPQVVSLIQDITTASHRAVSLTRGLLAFSRHQTLQPQPVDLNALLARLRSRLSRALGRDNELVLESAPGLPEIVADAPSLEWILTQLGSNARDAMPQGGRWTLRTEFLPGKDVESPDLAQPGPLVCLSAADTGLGIEPAVQERLFEPFFTTKEIGQGNGLGLASVYGIVQQLQGRIEVASRPGQGTVFRIFLPTVESAPPPTTAANECPAQGRLPIEAVRV